MQRVFGTVNAAVLNSKKKKTAAFENLTLEKQSSKIKMLESIRDEKEVQKKLTFAYDSVETENKNKEVLECQLVSTS